MNFLSLEEGESITSILAMPKELKNTGELSLLMATKDGTVKKTKAEAGRFSAQLWIQLYAGKLPIK
jgi:DNA gyrase/topoisomerase IV subunit A